MTQPAAAAAPSDWPPIYFINLARSTTRRARMEQQLASWPGAVHRVEAVDGRSLGRMELMTRQALVSTLLRHGRLLRAGEIGTRLSHCTVYNRMIADGVPAAVVLEDDAMLDCSALQTLLSEIGRLELDWDLILLHNHSDLHPDKPYFTAVRSLADGFDIMGLLDEPCSSGAYLVTRNGAAKMLKMKRFDSPSDYWAWFALRTGLKVFAVHPVVARIDRQFASEVDAIAIRRADREKRIFWLFKKSRRAFRNRVRRHCRNALQRLMQTS